MFYFYVVWIGVILFKSFVLKLLKFYMEQVSPFFSLRCRYIPTCSRYTLDAVENFGVCKGLSLGLFRLLRCNIFFKGGFDPVKKCDSKNCKKSEEV